MTDTREATNHPAPQLSAVGARKAALRQRLLAARRALPSGVRADAAERVRAAMLALLAEADPATAAGYVPFGTEPGGPDLPAVLAGALSAGGRLLLPVLREDRGLDWMPYRDPDQRLAPAAIGDASVIVVPALAVDRRGVRLGRGGGSYDRALALASPGALVVALLHDGELREEELPAAPHDRRVTAVITPGDGLHWTLGH